MKSADLHLHSHFSDGTFSPKQLVFEALKTGLSCISITDHDSVEAIDLAIQEAGADLEIIPGIEMTAEVFAREVHILGYFIDYRNEDFLKMLNRMREARIKRIFGICEKLKKLGVSLDPKDVFDLAVNASVGRLHVARAMVKKGYCASIPEVFMRFIGDKGPAYVSKFKMSPKETVVWIKKVGGIPVLAHPHTLGDQSVVSDFVKDGIMGLEVFYTEHSDYQTKEFIKIAKKYNLLVTGGSDCHGSAKEDVHIGKVKLPYEYVEKLKEAKNKLS